MNHTASNLDFGEITYPFMGTEALLVDYNKYEGHQVVNMYELNQEEYSIKCATQLRHAILFNR